jgi:hypothetical protein
MYENTCPNTVIPEEAHRDGDLPERFRYTTPGEYGESKGFSSRFVALAEC